MIISRICSIPNKGKQKEYFYKDKKPITENEFFRLHLIKELAYECREVYYQKDGIEIREKFEVKGDN